MHTLLFAMLSACQPATSKGAHDTVAVDSGSDSGSDSGTDSVDSADSGTDSGTDTSADTGETGTTDTDTAPVVLNGEVPDVATALPTFSATNQDDEARGPSDVIGHPTVFWFYIAAATSG